MSHIIKIATTELKSKISHNVPTNYLCVKNATFMHNFEQLCVASHQFCSSVAIVLIYMKMHVLKKFHYYFACVRIKEFLFVSSLNK